MRISDEMKYYLLIFLVIVMLGGISILGIFEFIQELNCDYQCRLKEMCIDYCENQARESDFLFMENCTGYDLDATMICLCYENHSIVDNFDIKYTLRNNEKCKPN